jgi:hypothetical protein
MATNKRDLKAYVRFDGNQRVIPGSLVLRRAKPKVGNWKEIQTYECCDGGGGNCWNGSLIAIPTFFTEEGICVGSFGTISVYCNDEFLQAIELSPQDVQSLQELVLSECLKQSPLYSVTKDIVDLLNTMTIPGISGFAYVYPGIISANVSISCSGDISLIASSPIIP